MSTPASKVPIIQTKFCPPRTGLGLVPRDRLLKLLNRSIDVPLTLVSAPAGYGKSILVSQWLEQQDNSAVWLSLDAADSNLMQFLSYLVVGLQNEFPKSLISTAGLLRLPERPSLEVISTYLLNDLNELDGLVSIVLDDYHHLQQSSAVHELLEQLLQYFPPQVKLILITRRDPPLPLIRLRALNHLVEVRLLDLQFSRAEIRMLLDVGNNIVPSEESLTRLQKEIEGWAVGLRLVSLALRQSRSPDELFNSLQGGIPQIQEYLLQEVLAGLSPSVRDYLLQSSLFDRFCAELLEFVNDDDAANSGSPGLDAESFIQQLENTNLFIINLDDRHHWFRFHHLFQQLLQQELERSLPPDRFEQKHLRASQWFENHGFLDDAIQLAMKAGDPVYAAEIIERHFYDELEADRWYVIDRWLDEIPEQVTHERATLLVARTWGFAFGQQIEKVTELVDELKPLLRKQGSPEGLRGELDFFRGWLLFWQGDFSEAARLLQRAHGRIDRHKFIAIAEADLHLAILLYMSGQAEPALEMMEKQISKHGGLQYARRIGALAFICMLGGDLAGLEVNATRMRTADSDMRSPLTDAWSNYFTACVDLYRNQLEAAAKNFSKVVARPHLIDRRAAIDAFAGLALARQMSGQPAEADQVLGRLMAFARESQDPENLALVQSSEARIGLLQGRARPPVRGQPDSVKDPGVFDLFLWLEAPAISYIRLLAAEGTKASLAKAQKLLDKVRQISQTSHFGGKLIEIEVIQSLILEKQGRGEEALQSVGKAIELAEPSAWVLPFLELGQPMEALLRRLSGQGQAGDFTQLLLTAFRVSGAGVQATATGFTLQSAGAALLASGEHDHLTNRELEILELLAQRMQNKEIANSLFISNHTVKDHLKHIYQKLGVSTRRQAVVRALQLEIIQPA